MIGPDHALVLIAAGGCVHMFGTDARDFEIHPYAALLTGAAAILLAGLTGPLAVASSLVGIALLSGMVAAIRAFSAKSLGLGDYSLFATCGALVGIDTLLPFLIMTSLFGMVASVVTGQLRGRKRLWSSYPMATAAIPAAMIATIARYHFGATFSKPFSWVTM